MRYYTANHYDCMLKPVTHSYENEQSNRNSRSSNNILCCPIIYIEDSVTIVY
jgi:hypothetical protein